MQPLPPIDADLIAAYARTASRSPLVSLQHARVRRKRSLPRRAIKQAAEHLRLRRRAGWWDGFSVMLSLRYSR